MNRSWPGATTGDETGATRRYSVAAASATGDRSHCGAFEPARERGPDACSTSVLNGCALGTTDCRLGPKGGEHEKESLDSSQRPPLAADRRRHEYRTSLLRCSGRAQGIAPPGFTSISDLASGRNEVPRICAAKKTGVIEDKRLTATDAAHDARFTRQLLSYSRRLYVTFLSGRKWCT